MNKMITFLAILASCGAFANESATTNDAPAEAAAPVAEAAEAAPQATAGKPTDAASNPLAESRADEIDLDEDDSFLASKRPQIKPLTSSGAISLVDIDCDDATIADVLRQFRKTTGANIISGESTNLLRRVSVTLRRVPWLQALTSILNSRGFRLDERDNIYRVVEDLQVIPLQTTTFELNHASAKELAKLFNIAYARKDAKGNPIQPIATCFEGANVVVVTADEKTISDCAGIVKAVDRAVAQICIEARFAELSSQALHKLGVQWNQLESWGASINKVEAGASWSQNPNGKVGLNNDSATAMRHDVGGKANYISGTLSADDFRLALSAFESAQDAKIFSNPKVIVSNGKEAKVDMTTKFPNVELTSQRNTQSGTTYTDFTARIQEIPGNKDTGMFAGQAFYSWGITLSVKPRISRDGLISVEIVPTISQLDLDVTEDGFYKIVGSDNDASYSRYPIINMKSISTDFTMKDGATAVIGGLSRTVEEDVDTGIPYLHKIPWIGQTLFGWKSRQKVQKEIIVFVTIGIANPAELPKDLGLPKNAVLGREYITGARLEPGDRKGTASEVLQIDTRPLHDKKRTEQPTGSVVMKLSE